MDRHERGAFLYCRWMASPLVLVRQFSVYSLDLLLKCVSVSYCVVIELTKI